MKLSSILDPGSIVVGSTIKGLDDAVTQVAEQIIKVNHLELNTDQIRNCVLKKEQLVKIQKGIATLNYHPEQFDDFLIGICIPLEPFMLPTGKKIDMVVLIISPKSSARMTLNTKLVFEKIYENKPLLNMLITVADAETFIDLIRKNDISIKKELSVADIMVKEIVSVKPETSVKDIIDIFFRDKISYVPVIDSSGNFVGEITVREILSRGIPDYAEMIGNLKFLNSLEPFDELLLNEEKIIAKEIMTKPSLKVSPDTSILEVALEIHQNRRRHLPVVSENKMVGIVSFMDILNKILRV